MWPYCVFFSNNRPLAKFLKFQKSRAVFERLPIRYMEGRFFNPPGGGYGVGLECNLFCNRQVTHPSHPMQLSATFRSCLTH